MLEFTDWDDSNGNQFSLSKYFSLPEGSGMICGEEYIKSEHNKYFIWRSTLHYRNRLKRAINNSVTNLDPWKQMSLLASHLLLSFTLYSEKSGLCLVLFPPKILWEWFLSEHPWFTSLGQVERHAAAAYSAASCFVNTSLCVRCECGWDSLSFRQT